MKNRYSTPPSNREDAQTTVYLHPEQITSRFPVKSTAQNQNMIIRLATSIQKYGVLEPISVKSTPQTPQTQQYELIDGERRLRAATLAGLTALPCRILPEHHKSCALAGILSQLCCKNLHFFEQAAAFQMLINDFSLTQEEIARRTGFSQSAIANKLRLLSLSKDEQAQIALANLTERHARAILRLKSPTARNEAILRIKQGRLSVCESEKLVEILLAEEAAGASGRPDGAVKTFSLPVTTPSSGATPRKFALQNLTPLYNSIERSLSIFRKTGMSATCRCEEGADGTRIIIDIPKNTF